jgi:hypothetical protein
MRMGKQRSMPDHNRQAVAYRDLAKEALDSVAIYNARAQWFECSGNKALSIEYRLLSKDALERAQRYKDLADLADKHPPLPLKFEMHKGKPAQEKAAVSGLTRASDSSRNPIKKRPL